MTAGRPRRTGIGALATCALATCALATCAVVLVACNTGESSEPASCVAASGNVAVCSQGESDARWLAVTAVPGTPVSWTVDGRTLAADVPGNGRPLRIDLPDRVGGPPLTVTVDGTALDRTPFTETVTVG